MNRVRYVLLLPCLMACGAVAMPSVARAAPASPTLPAPAPDAAAWQTPPPAEVRTQFFAWLDAQKPAADVRAKLEAAWADVPANLSEDVLLTRLATSFAAVDPRARELVDRCSRPRAQLSLPSVEWLRDPRLPPLPAHNLRLFYARWLVGESLFDEAAGELTGLTPRDVIAPASLLFYQSVAYHALLNKKDGLKTIEQLLRGSETSPKRYITLARLMRDDLQGLKEDSLDHIARQMSDVRRRLDLGRAGPKVRQAQADVIAALDKLIKKLEDQQQSQSGSAAGGSAQSSNPAQDSYLKGGSGPGNVTKRNIGSGAGWGDLPPKEREEALQQIGRDLPTHYRDVIEQYFRRLATEQQERENERR